MENKNIQQHITFVIIGMILGLPIGFSFDNAEYLLPVIYAIGIGIASGLTSFFLQFCYQEGNIFGWYRTWLDNNVGSGKIKLLQPFYSPLGGCAYCQNAWVCITGWTAVHISIGLTWWMLIPCIVFGHLVLTVLDHLFWQ